jgi:hypothetical protein
LPNVDVTALDGALHEATGTTFATRWRPGNAGSSGGRAPAATTKRTSSSRSARSAVTSHEVFPSVVVPKDALMATSGRSRSARVRKYFRHRRKCAEV